MYLVLRSVVVEGLTLVPRGRRPQMVAVFKEDEEDFRLKLFVSGGKSEGFLDVHVRGERVVFQRKSPTLIEARFEEKADLEEVLARPKALGVEKSVEGSVRAEVPVPTGELKFPYALWSEDKRRGCTVLTSWIGRIPEQFHRHRKAPVLEMRGKAVYAYGTHLDVVSVHLNGQTLDFKRDVAYTSVHEDRFVCPMTPAELESIRTWERPRRQWRPPELSEAQIERRVQELMAERGGEYLDVCVETRFEAVPGSEHSDWSGDVLDWPEWMGARSVFVSPPETSGGAHGVRMEAPGLRRKGYPTIRLNGVWMLSGPGSGEGEALLWCDPVELGVVREYGSVEGDTLTLPNQPSSIRTRRDVKALHSLLKREKYGPGLPAKAYRPWTEACMELSNAVGVLAVWQGQVDYNRRTARRCEVEAETLEARVKARFDQRPPAYLTYSMVDWVEEVGDGKYVKPRTWLERARKLRVGAKECSDRVQALMTTILEKRGKYHRAVGVIEQLEAEWEDLVLLRHEAE